MLPQGSSVVVTIELDVVLGAIVDVVATPDELDAVLGVVTMSDVDELKLKLMFREVVTKKWYNTIAMTMRKVETKRIFTDALQNFFNNDGLW